MLAELSRSLAKQQFGCAAPETGDRIDDPPALELTRLHLEEIVRERE